MYGLHNKGFDYGQIRLKHYGLFLVGFWKQNPLLPPRWIRAGCFAALPARAT